MVRHIPKEAMSYT